MSATPSAQRSNACRSRGILKASRCWSFRGGASTIRKAYTFAVKQSSEVSVLVLNLNGRPHLDACFASLEAQTYPRDRFEVVLVDNGSTDGSIAFVTRRYPRTRVFGRGGNEGFCASYNAAIRSCESEFVALLNNDARVDPQWLAELVSAARAPRAVAVASKILDWNGDTIDFVGGATSFIGHSVAARLLVSRRRAAYEERPLLFSVRRLGALLSRGLSGCRRLRRGFFRILRGCGPRVAPEPFRRDRGPGAEGGDLSPQHGTSSRWAFAQRLRLLERNALAMIYKNYEAATLERVFPAAIALLLLRRPLRSGIDSLKLALSDRPPDVDRDRIHTWPLT